MPRKYIVKLSERKAPKHRDIAERFCFKSLQSFSNAAKVFVKKCNNWKIKLQSETELYLVKDSKYDQEEFSIFVNQALSVEIHHFGWPGVQQIVNLATETRSFNELICHIEELKLCRGIQQQFTRTDTRMAQHILTIRTKPFEKQEYPKVIKYATR